MNSRIFFWNIIVRVALIMATTFLFIWLTETAAVEFIFTIMAGAALIIIQVILLTRYVLGITRLMEQFLDAVSREGTPEIQFGTGNALFRRLKERSNSIKRMINARRLEKAKDDQILLNVINSADLGLFCFNSEGEVLFANESAKELIYNNEFARMEEIRSYNKKLWQALDGLEPGSPRVVRLQMGPGSERVIRGEQLISIRLKEVRILDENYKLFSLQNIQEELHKNESDSWQKIIRVLTHEIMNAVTPMLSLSKSMQTRLQSESGDDARKVLEGLKTIESTGKGLMDFIEEYRQLSLLPQPKRAYLLLEEALEGIRLLFENEAEERKIQLSIELEEPGIKIFADPQQFEMILLNLLRNSFDSFADNQHGKAVLIRAQKHQERIRITVEDNGCGIAEELIDQVFVPFFSTKENGSGIGLSLVRQVMNNHEGSIHLESVPGERTILTLIF